MVSGEDASDFVPQLDLNHKQESMMSALERKPTLPNAKIGDEQVKKRITVKQSRRETFFY